MGKRQKGPRARGLYLNYKADVQSRIARGFEWSRLLAEWRQGPRKQQKAEAFRPPLPVLATNVLKGLYNFLRRRIEPIATSPLAKSMEMAGSGTDAGSVIRP